MEATVFPNSKTRLTPGPLTHSLTLTNVPSATRRLALLPGCTIWGLYDTLQGSMPEPVSKQSNDLFDAIGYLSSLQYTASVCDVYFFLALMCGTAPNALYTPGTQ